MLQWLKSWFRREDDKHAREFLAEVATVINRHGEDSPEVIEYIAVNARNDRERELANLSRELKKAFRPRPMA